MNLQPWNVLVRGMRTKTFGSHQNEKRLSDEIRGLDRGYSNCPPHMAWLNIVEMAELFAQSDGCVQRESIGFAHWVLVLRFKALVVESTTYEWFIIRTSTKDILSPVAYVIDASPTHFTVTYSHSPPFPPFPQHWRTLWMPVMKVRPLCHYARPSGSLPIRWRRFASSAPEAPRSSRWLSETKRRVGNCIMFGLDSAQAKEAGRIASILGNEWKGLVGESEGFRLDGQWAWEEKVLWGEMVRN